MKFGGDISLLPESVEQAFQKTKSVNKQEFRRRISSRQHLYNSKLALE
jgi:hypothetical protein